MSEPELLAAADAIAAHPAARWVRRISAGSIVVFGVTLMVFAATRFHGQESECVQNLGPIARCARPKLYFHDGFTAPTGCAFDQVEAFDCGGVLDRGVLRDDDASTFFYSTMKLLTKIDRESSEISLFL